jgi:hypothetical protein
MALEEMLKSEQIKMLPNDFPFIDDFIKLFDQFLPLSRALEGDKEGIKFTLNKAAIVRYIMISLPSYLYKLKINWLGVSFSEFCM